MTEKSKDCLKYDKKPLNHIHGRLSSLQEALFIATDDAALTLEK